MLNLLPATVRSQVDTTLKRAAEYVDGSVPVPDDLLDMGEPSSKGRVDYTPFQGLLHTIRPCSRGKCSPSAISPSWTAR
jgi:hypothetical protein